MPAFCAYHSSVVLPDKFKPCWKCVDEFFARRGLVSHQEVIMVDESDFVVEEVANELDRILDGGSTQKAPEEKADEPSITIRAGAPTPFL